jgi:hypothetical protein
MGAVLERLEVMIGKRLLVGITYVGSVDGPGNKLQFVGVVTEVDPEVVIDHDSAEPFRLPAESDAYNEAPPGEYTLHGTGEAIEDPDFMTIWTVNPPDKWFDE